MTQTLIYDLLMILAAGLLAGLVCRRFRVSVLIGYLLVGILLGEGLLDWVPDENHELEHFAEAGVFLLLFSIGLEFSLDDMRRLGRRLFIGGSVQMLLVAAPVAWLLLACGKSWQAALLIAAAVAFSSTVLVFKALSEYGQTEQPHGIRAIGILLFQDAALVPLLLLVPLLTGSEEGGGAGQYVRLAAISILFVIAVAGLRLALARWAIPTLTRYRSPDLVVLTTVVVLGGVTMAAHAVGLPATVGAFAAGLIFNGNRWTRQIDALVLPFRETFAAIFFVSLGLILDPGVLLRQPLLMTGLFVLVIALKAAAATVALLLTGMNLRRSFGMGVGLAHVGEFAFVLVLLGSESGVIERSDYQRLVAIAVGSLVLTPALIRLGLKLIHDENVESVDEDSETWASDVSRTAVVIGAGPIGRQIASQLESIGKDVCLVDLSQINLHPFALEGFRTVAGDATDRATLEHAEVGGAAFVAVCVPDDGAAIRVVRAVRRLNRGCYLVVRCRYHASESPLRKAGADRVVTEETEASLKLLATIRDMNHASATASQD